MFVHCVGINDRRPIEDYSASDWDRIIGVNLTSAFHTATEAAVGMREQRDGRILFFSSVAGRSGHKHHGPYAATKGAINQLMRVIAHEYAEHGVTANAVAPGYMDTTLTRSYLAANPDKRAALVELIPAGRFGTLQEVVDPCCSCAHRTRASSRVRSCTSTAVARSSSGPARPPRALGATCNVDSRGAVSWSPARGPASAPHWLCARRRRARRRC